MDFKPSSAQRRLLDYIHENPSPLPTLRLCESANVSRASFYRWCRDPHFRAWLGIAWTSRLLIDGISLMNQARAQAPEKFPYWRALSDLTFDPKGLGTIAKWGESLVHLSPDAFIPGPDVKSKPKPKPPAGPRPQPDWVAELYKDSEFPPPPPPEIGPNGFPIYHPESVEEWNKRHGFIDEPPDDPKVFSVAQPGRRGPRLSGLEVHRERAARRSRAGRPRSINAGRPQSTIVNPVRAVLLLQRALNPSYPLRRRRCASPGSKPPRRGPRPSGLDRYREWVAWRRGLQRCVCAERPSPAIEQASATQCVVCGRSPAGRPRSRRASPVAKPGRRGPRLSGLEDLGERAAGRSPAGRPRLRNETVNVVEKPRRTPCAGANGTAAKSAPVQQPRAFSSPHTRGQSSRRGLNRCLALPHCIPADRTKLRFQSASGPRRQKLMADG